MDKKIKDYRAIKQAKSGYKIPEAIIDGTNLSKIELEVDTDAEEAGVSFEEGKLTFSIPKPADGKDGKDGQQGPQGDSAVYNPDDPDAPVFEMANTTGQSTTKAMTQKAVTDELNNINRNIEPIEETFDKIPYFATFNGTTSKASCTSIVLQNEGDYLEIEVFPPTTSTNSIYALANNGGTTIRFSLTDKGFYCRADDNTWLLQKNNTLTALSHFTAKIVYEDSKIKFYRDDTLIDTYNSQKKITISRWGLYNNGSNDYYWTGKIGRISINGTAYRHIGQIPGWSPTNVSIGASHVFMTDEQYNMLASAALPKIVIIPNEQEESIIVRTNICGNIYASFSIARQLNNDDSGGINPYEDVWRLTTGYAFRYDDGNFTYLNIKLLVGAENEFAINLQGMGDFIGGYHGNEKIVEEGDYVKFFVDGKAYTFSELAALGTFSCNKFWYEEVTTLFASYSYNVNHLKIGKHFKRTELVDGGYKTTNYVSFDLSALSVDSINLITAFTGLVCVHKDASSIITSDVGVEYTASHPSTSVVLASNVDKYSRRLEMRNGNVSCNLDSKLLKSNIDGFDADMNPNVHIYDRQNDAKYYSYLVNGTKAISTGKYIATECEVKFLYKV